jgi:DNA-binding CsgD family transcriptional regulator
MRFREISPADVPHCVRLLIAHGGLRLSERVRDALPALWSMLASSSAPHPSMLIEDAEAAGHPVVCVVPGFFLCDEFVHRYRQAPRPYLLNTIYEALLDGERPLPSLEEVRIANSGNGLQALISNPAYEPRPWHDPLLARMRRIAPMGFVHLFGGYRLRSLYYEAFGDDAADYLRAGGFRLEVEFAPQDGHPQLRPRMFVKHRTDVEPGAIDLLAAHVFHFAEPRLGLTPGEQRVVLRALLGESDRRIAAALHLSTETVRSAWESIYGRILRVVPAVFECEPCDRAGRGAEKRRSAVEYLRQHMHELRPHRAPDSGASRSPHRLDPLGERAQAARKRRIDRLIDGQ